jgi:hypothetical protein
MRTLWLILILAAASFPAAAQDPAVDPKARDRALARAFKHLDEGLWKLNEHGSPRKQFSVAVAAWAYLMERDRRSGAGKLPSRGKALRRMRGYLDRYVESVAREYARDDKRTRQGKANPMDAFRRPSQYTWPLSMAAHFYAESMARGKMKRSSRKMLKAIVLVLEASQQPNGGWGHDDAAREGMGIPPIQIPKPGGGSLTYPGTLLAASNCALSGLGVGHRMLTRRPQADSLEKGRGYFEKAQNLNGTFPYDPTQRHGVKTKSPMAGGIEVARTSGAIFAMLCAGANAQDSRILKGLEAVDARPDLMSEGHGSASLALLFGALLSKARGEEAWAEFRRVFFPRILAAQEDDGAFACVCKHASPAVTCDTRELPGLNLPGYVEEQKTYVTAIHTLVLLLDRARLEAIPRMPPRKPPVTSPPEGRK